MDAKSGMLCWTPYTDKIKVVDWPDVTNQSDGYACTGLACYTDIQKSSFEKRKTIIFIEAMHLIIRDGMPPQKVHEALCVLDEYIDGLADDVSVPELSDD